MLNHPLLFATESRYKIALLKRLNIAFDNEPAHLDETPMEHEDPGDLSRRLARAKAEHVWAKYPHRCILAGDQAAGLGDGILSKPGSIEEAMMQLTRMSGQRISFHTSICLLHPSEQPREHTEVVTAQLRRISADEIRRYVLIEQPLDCAGSFKVEALGISLFSAIESRDPTALEGLPLIQLAQWLREIGFQAP